MTENHFRSHFSLFQINTQLLFFLFFSQNGCRRPFWMTENHFRSHFSPLQINTQLLFIFIFFTKWLPAAILDDRKSLSIAFLATFIFFTKWLPAAILEDRKLLFDFAPFQINTQHFFSQNSCRRPFWMTENHFQSHFSPFQINMQL